MRLITQFIFVAVFIVFAAQSAFSQSTQIRFAFNDAVDLGGEQVSAAFHAVTFIDAQAASLGHIQFASASAHAIQTGGWLPDSNDAQMGGIQWSQQTASLNVTLPTGTEGMLFTVLGARDGIWAEVEVDGAFVPELRVDAYWHDAYVPVGEPALELLPEVGPVWFEDRNFPAFPPSERLYGIRVVHDQNDWGFSRTAEFRINHSFGTMAALTLVGMQGLINRRTPRVFLNWQGRIQEDNVWSEEIGRYAAVEHLDLDAMSAIHFLWRKFSYLFEGAVVYDPEVANTINLATMFAGLENRLILAPDQLAVPGMPVPTDVRDLVAMAAIEGWDNTEEGQFGLYQWVYDNLWANLEKRIIGVISPGPPMAGEGGPVESYPVDLSTRDWYIALNLTALHLDPENEPQAGLFRQFLADGPSPKPVTGVFRNNEEKTLLRASENGDWIAGINWPGFDLSAGNLSVMGGVGPEPKPYVPRIDPDRIMRSLTAPHVATLWTPDGDHMVAQAQFAPLLPDLKDQYLGYTLGPWYTELAPILWDYYTRRDGSEVNNLSIVNALSGGGYARPYRMPSDKLDAYLDQAARMMRRSGLTVVYFDDEGWPADEAVARKYHEKLSPAGTIGTLMATRRFGDETMHTLKYSGVSTPQVWISEKVAERDNTASVVNRLMAVREGHHAYDLSSDHTTIGVAVPDAAAVGGEALEFPADMMSHASCCRTVDFHSLVMPPGEYSATMRMKVSDRSDTSQSLGISIIDQARPSEVSSYYAFAPADFSADNEYQEFSVSFTLDHWTEHFEVTGDYLGGAAIVTADVVEIERQGTPVVPFSAVRMYAGFAFVGVPDIKLPNKFVDKFESEGGVFLYPEEFLGSLNPEFMIDLAHQYLPAGDPLVLEAEAELALGHHYDAVLKVRAALLAGTGVSTEPSTPPKTVMLESVYPNPVRSRASVEYAVDRPQLVRIEVYDLLGRRTALLREMVLGAGRYSASLDVSDWPAGAYFVRLEAGMTSMTRTMLVVR